MILSNIDIHRALDEGDIVLKPEPMPRLRSLTHPESPYDTTAVNLRLATALSIADERKPFAFDLRTKGLPGFLTQVYTPVTMDTTGGYVLKPGLFVLGKQSNGWSCRSDRSGPYSRLASRGVAHLLDADCWFISQPQPFMRGSKAPSPSRS
jgi:hypothetical protein